MSEKILILVKTYPTFSQKYFELVCTAGINEQGQWRRIYPIPFRDLPMLEQYKKYQWIEADLEKNYSDGRPESFKLNGKIKTLDHTESKDWQKRKDILFKNTPVFRSLKEIIDKARSNEMSLCIFKPTEILDFIIEETDREWNKKTLETIENENKQESLFPELKKEINIVPKLPYKFSYQFQDENGKKSKLMIEDWEIGQLYWNCFKRKQNEVLAIEDVKKKYKEEFLNKKEIYLFLGTTKKFHRRRARNPYVIIGVFYPPKVTRGGLF